MALQLPQRERSASIDMKRLRNFMAEAEFRLRQLVRVLTVNFVPQPLSASAQRHWMLAVAALILMTALGGLLDPLLAISRHIPLDYNEGWNAYWQATASQGGDLYPPPSSTVVNNYPPLSFYLVGFVGRHLGDNIVAGRWLAFLSLIWIASNVGLWLRASGSSRVIAALGSVTFLTALVNYAPYYVAMNDPQLLAHAVMTSALVVLWRWRCNRGAAIAAGILMVVAGFIKHLLIPIPIATAVFLLLRDRRCFEVWFVAAAAALTLGFALTWQAYGISFFNALNLPRTYDVEEAAWQTFKTLVMLSPLLACACIATWGQLAAPRRAKISDRALFALLYLTIAGTSGAFAAGGAGLDKNAFFDLLIAACLCAALAIENLTAKVAALQISLALLCAAFVTAAAIRLPEQIDHVRTLSARELEAARDIDLIASLGDNDVACETLALCYWAKRPFALDFFSYGQKLVKSVLPASSCESVFGTSIKVVQFAHDDDRTKLGSDLLPDACNAVIVARLKQLHRSAFSLLMTSDGVKEVARGPG